MSSLTRLWGGSGGGRGHKTIPMARSPPTLAPLVASATPQAQPSFIPPPPKVPQPQIKPQPPLPQPPPPPTHQAPVQLPPVQQALIQHSLQPPLPPLSQLLPPPPNQKTRQATAYLPSPPPIPAKPKDTSFQSSENRLLKEPGSKDVWGPKVWRILHNMAWLSDRADVFFIWKLMLKSLADVMPCATCRQHLSQYLNTNSLFMVKNIHMLKGSDVKTRMVQALWSLHNDVNLRTGKGSYTLEELNMMYLNIPRNQILNETYTLLTEIYQDWEPIVVKQITGGAFREWRANTIMFMSLANAGPQLT